MADPKYDSVLGNIFEESAQEPIIPSRRLDPRTAGLFSETVHTTIKDIASDKDASGDIGRKAARVCLVFKKEDGYLDQAISWVGGFFGDGAEDRLSVIAYCPRVHSMLPDPFAIAQQKKIWPVGASSENYTKWVGLVNSILPTGMKGSARFTATNAADAEDKLSGLSPGNWVWVSYGDETNKTNGFLLEPISETTGEDLPDELPSPKDAHKRREEGGAPGWRKTKNKGVQLSPGATLDESSAPPPDEVAWLVSAPAWARGGDFHPDVKKRGRFHKGVDIYAPEGSQIYSATDGIVTHAKSISGYGLAVVVFDPELKREFLYGHLSNRIVSKNDAVKKGQQLGHLGKTKHAKGSQFFVNPNEKPHLHFEVLPGGRADLPAYIKRKRRREDPQAWLRDKSIEMSKGKPA